MTVAQLIEHLKTFPQEATVIRTFCSDFSEVTADQIHGHAVSDYSKPCQVVFRGDKFVEFDPATWPPGETPVFVKCVHFAGN